MNSYSAQTGPRNAPHYAINPALLLNNANDFCPSRRSSFSSHAGSDVSESSVFSQQSFTSSATSASSIGHGWKESSHGESTGTSCTQAAPGFPCANTVGRQIASSFLNLGAYHEETDWAGAQLRAALPAVQTQCNALEPSQHAPPPPQSVNPRRSITSQTWQKPTLQRQTDKRQILVEHLVDSATQLVAVIWPSAIACPGANTSTTSGTVIPLRTFIRETLRRSRTSHSTLQVTLYYLVLIKSRAGHLLAQSSGRQGGESRALSCGRRMFLAALILASKYLQDRNYSARAWTKISGLRNQEISHNEMAFLFAVQWKLHVKLELFHQWTDIVHRCTDMLDSRPIHQSAWSTVVHGVHRGWDFHSIRLALWPTQLYTAPYPSPGGSMSEVDIEPSLLHAISASPPCLSQPWFATTSALASLRSSPDIHDASGRNVLVQGAAPSHLFSASSSATPSELALSQTDIGHEKTSDPVTRIAASHHGLAPSVASASTPSISTSHLHARVAGAPSPVEDAPHSALQIQEYRARAHATAASHLPSPPTSDAATSPPAAPTAPTRKPHLRRHVGGRSHPTLASRPSSRASSSSASSSSLFDPLDMVYSPASFGTPALSDLRTRLTAPCGSKRGRDADGDAKTALPSCCKRACR